MTTVINQPFGIGDVIWSMTLAEQFRATSDQIIWPVFPQFLDGLRRAYPKIHWQDHSVNPSRFDVPREIQTYGQTRYIPLRWSMEITKTPYDNVMAAKYEMYGQDWRTWRDKAPHVRDYARERALIASLNLPDRFALVNRTYQSDAKGKSMIDPQGLPVIEMQTLPGFSLFDWAGVLELAAEIHFVSSSTLYLIELLPLKCPIHIYPRPTDPGFRQVAYIFTKPYIRH